MLVKHVCSDVKPAFLVQRKFIAGQRALVSLGVRVMSFECVHMSFDVRVLGLQQMVDMDIACAGLMDELVAYATLRV